MIRGLQIALVVLGIAAPVAVAMGDGSRQTSSYQLSQSRPASGTGEHFLFDYVNPDDPAAKPPPVRRVETILPPGARFDTTVPESCGASDPELMALGAAACPAGSAIGGGVLTVDTGLPGPARIVTADIDFFNNAADPGGEFIYLATVRGTPAALVVRADVDGRRTITTSSMLPGTLPDGGAIDTVDVSVDSISRDGRHYITTPRRCSKRGFWRTRVAFTYADGARQAVGDRSPCERGPGRG